MQSESTCTPLDGGIFVTSRRAARREFTKSGSVLLTILLFRGREKRLSRQPGWYSISLANCDPGVSYIYRCILRTRAFVLCVRMCGFEPVEVEGHRRKRDGPKAGRTRRSCPGVHDAHTPVPPSQFVTDEAIGNKQRGDSNCLSFSAVVHWVLSSR